MTDTHRYTFFGKNMGLIILSFKKSDPFLFFHMIKRKLNGEWEKPSKNEGKRIKFSLEELIFILQVAKHEKESWKTSHEYNENTTEILFNWEEDNSEGGLWIFADKYSKILTSAEIELFSRLLNHILEEKIQFSTNSKTENQLNMIDQGGNRSVKALIKIQGMIKRTTKKALLLIFIDSTEAWIPKSAIHSDFNREFKGHQLFLIEQWVLQKKKIFPQKYQEGV